MRFWDSSAIVPLIVKQRLSGPLEQLHSEDRSIAVWAITPVEIVGGLWLLVRNARISDEQRVRAEIKLAELERTWTVIANVVETIRIARRLFSSHPLRAGDALQLAAAMTLVEDQAGGFDFVTLDSRLAEAAGREGFTVLTA